MKKYIYSIMAVATLMCMASCSQEEIVKQNAAKPGELIQFGLGQPGTRTMYDTDDAWQIVWQTGDKITVFCDEAETVKEADYTVIPTLQDHIATTPQDTSKYGVLEVNDNGLVWSGTNNENTVHNFYAAYPADVNKVQFEDGLLKFKVSTQQKCKTSGYPLENGTPKAGSTCVATCDMTDAYMVAYAQATPASVEATPLTLNFKPVMTTLEVTIQGFPSDAQNDKLNVQGLGITVGNVPMTENDEFIYNAKEGNIVSNSSTTNKADLNFFVSFTDDKGNDLDYITINGTQKITMTVLLPPVDINASNNVNIRVMAEGNANYSVTMGEVNATSVAASAKKLVQLPVLDATKVEGNNWITPLADNIYVSQLSIPGTISSLSSGSYNGLATAQGKTLVEQWADGVRAFEFRSSQSSVLSFDSGLNLYDGGVNLSNGSNAQYGDFSEAVEALYGLLTGKSKGEFAILINSYQAEQYSGWQGTVNKYFKKPWVSAMQSQMNSIYSQIHFVNWRPDLTVGEARGKVILINLDAYGPENDYGDNDIYYNNNVNYHSALVLDAMSIDRKTTTWLVKYSRDGRDYNTAGTWHDVAYGGTSTASGSTIASNGIYIQNLFGQYPTRETADLPESSQVKYSERNKETAVLDADSIAQSLTEEANKNKWVINSIGGANATSTDEYKKAAAHINQYYKSHVLNNASRPKAPTGIVLVAHQGLDEYEESLVYGLTMPQMIINNNYKYRAQRKPAQ